MKVKQETKIRDNPSNPRHLTDAVRGQGFLLFHVKQRWVMENQLLKNASEIILYRTEDDRTEIQVTLQDETVWLSQAQMAELFQKSVPTINEHIKNIYDEGELSENRTIRKFRIVQT
jgi:hypothetical protein